MREDPSKQTPPKPTFADFIAWERKTHDVLDFKKIYVDIAGDLHGGIVLSELLYWYLPAKDGSSRLRVRKRGRMWIAVRRWEWWTRCRLTPRQADRALEILVKAGLIEKTLHKFDGEPTVHVALNEEAFLRAWAECLDHPKLNPFLPEGYSDSPVGEPDSPVGEPDSPVGEPDSPVRESGFTSRGNPLTETTAENTTSSYKHSTADAEERDKADFVNGLEEDDPDIELLADAFGDFAGLKPVPVKGDAKWPDWWKSYKQLFAVCLDADIVPPELALLCAMKRDELGFLAGRPGAYVKTAQNLGVALSDPDQRTRLLWQLKEYINERVSAEKREEWRDWI